MDHFKAIYQQQAAAYQRMIAAEDADQQLLPALQRLAPLEGSRLLDLGTGTGRIPQLCHHLPISIVGLDLHEAMVRENGRQRERLGGDWALLAGDMMTLPLASASFDVVIAGWALGHFTGWYGDGWRSRAAVVLAEMERVVVPAGTILILETMGTGSLSPAPPNDALAAYYAWLEGEHGFQRTVIATDYFFETVEEAVEAMEFFFGRALSEQIRQHRWWRVPEWTGIWHRTTPPSV